MSHSLSNSNSPSHHPYRLLAPGPVPVPAAVIKAMSGPVLHHRTPEFERILIETWRGLQYVFGTQQPVMMITGSGSAGMEAAVVNTLSPGDEALVIVSGKFGERWADICERYGVTTHRLNVEWGQPVSLDDFAKALQEHSQIKVVFTQVCETSTATIHPIESMAKLVRKQAPLALFAVDAITAVGCMNLPMDEWGLDVVVGGSQKAFMIPTGLSFIALSERAWASQTKATSPRYYFDLGAERKANSKNETHFSAPTPLITGLHKVVARVQEVGLEKLIARCSALAQATQAAGRALGLNVYSQAPSTSVTALEINESAKVRDWLEKERNITVMGGQDQLKGKILRVGHMGDVHNEDMMALFEALAEYLHKPSFDKTAFLNALKSTEPLFA